MKRGVKPSFERASLRAWGVIALAGATAFAGCDGGPGHPAPGGKPPDEEAQSTFIEARIRRLTNAEFDRSVAVLLGTQKQLGASFAPDVRQNGFSANAEQRVDSVLADQIASAATEARSSIVETLVAYVKSDLFVTRKVEP